MSGIYNGHLLEFPLIRVDCFTTQRPEDVWLLPHPLVPQVTRPAPVARLYLLSHVHTDHLVGLENVFTSKILCHPDTKRMLLRLEAENDRRNLHAGTTELVKRKYAGLVARRQVQGQKEHWVDQIETLPYGVPKEFDLGWYGEERCVVTITLLDANHCPGSAMFLIAAKDRAVLHSGDIRADRLFMQQLMREPAIQEFLVPRHSTSPDPNPMRRLDRLYLDTSQSMDSTDMPQKEDAIRELMYVISQYPPDTVFFFNTWCWGWEDVIIAVAREFGTKVHLDRYKLEVYQALSTKFMAPFVTSDESSRFHACERLFRCTTCRGPTVVSVGMAEMNLAGWDLRAAAFRSELAQAKAGEKAWPTEFNVPFARHSSLPELRNFVGHFRPSSLSLNTMLSASQLYLLHESFAGTVPPSGAIEAETRAWFAANPAYGQRWLQIVDLQAAVLPSSTSSPSELQSFLEIRGVLNSTAATSTATQEAQIPQPTIPRASPPPDARTTDQDAEDGEELKFISSSSPGRRATQESVAPRRKRVRTASRKRSKYAVDVQSLSKLLERPL